MPDIFKSLLHELEDERGTVLVTILASKGSAPQVPGSSAVFSRGSLKAGTLGGGIMEGDATRRSTGLSDNISSFIYEYSLHGDFTAEQGAICGGTVYLLFDANPGRNRQAFSALEKSVNSGENGVLVTRIKGKKKQQIERNWLENGITAESGLSEYQNEISSCLDSGECLYLNKSEELFVFIQAVYPLPKIIIAGAGHIGKALAHMAKLLDFEVTVIDNRPEYANQDNIPDADHIIVDDIGRAISGSALSKDTYIVIVTRGHRDDAAALKACINEEVPYIGMIGSRRKVRLMRENFLRENWASAQQFDRVHAPVGLDIHSQTIQEIALSICAQLVQVRNQGKPKSKSRGINAIILAAGTSSRMGVPKMLLPFGDKSIIEKIVSNAAASNLRKVTVVLGANSEAIHNLLREYPVEIILNRDYENGMLSSVQCGLKSLKGNMDGVMILLGDQPMISSTIIDKVLDAWRYSEKGILVASFNKKRGHPLLIGKKYFREVEGFRGDKSLKDLLLNHPDDIVEIETGSPEILRDIDTYEEYTEELKNLNNYE